MNDDTEEILQLIYRYADAFDAGDLDAFAELFARGTLRVAGVSTVCEGSEAVRKQVSSAILYDGVPGTRHVNTNSIIDYDPARISAAVRTYFTVFQAVRDFPLQPIALGRYFDRFECEDGAWRFADREIRLEMIGDLSRHVGASMLAELDEHADEDELGDSL